MEGDGRSVRDASTARRTFADKSIKASRYDPQHSTFCGGRWEPGCGSQDPMLKIRPLISVVIPTFKREQVLLDTIKALIPLKPSNKEILIVDQTAQHSEQVENELCNLSRCGDMRWIRLGSPSIPAAMNKGAALAEAPIVLFLDDDIIPARTLLQEHVKAHEVEKADLIAGRVIQPWDKGARSKSRFALENSCVTDEFIGANFSISKECLEKIGGFDENFKGAAYRYEKEFSDRLVITGGKLWFQASACVEHLHISSGGTRSHGDHLHSWNPRHPVGAYYYLLVSSRVTGKWRKMGLRLVNSVRTRHHLRKPWYIPVTLVSELSALFWALGLRIRGPQLPLKGEPS